MASGKGKKRSHHKRTHKFVGDAPAAVVAEEHPIIPRVELPTIESLDRPKPRVEKSFWQSVKDWFTNVG